MGRPLARFGNITRTNTSNSITFSYLLRLMFAKQNNGPTEFCTSILYKHRVLNNCAMFLNELINKSTNYFMFLREMFLN